MRLEIHYMYMKHRSLTRTRGAQLLRHFKRYLVCKFLGIEKGDDEDFHPTIEKHTISKLIANDIITRR